MKVPLIRISFVPLSYIGPPYNRAGEYNYDGEALIANSILLRRVKIVRWVLWIIGWGYS